VSVENDPAGDDPAAERLLLIREVRQRLESLRRAGVDRMPLPRALPTVRLAATRPDRPSPEPSAPAVPTPAPPPAPPPRPAARPSPPPQAPAALPIGSLFGEAEIKGEAVPAAERPARLAVLAEQVAGCTRCPELASTRTRTVFADGSPNARLMFVGEAPGADEDRTGVPFVGKAGQLLTDMITKGMGLAREDVYIANILKCRPPDNRNPEAGESANCLGYLESQIEVVRPEYLCFLGKVAAGTLLETALPLARLRGRWHRYKGIPTVVTYHPAYLLRTPADKKKTWEDLQMLMQAMGLKPPPRKK